MFTDLGKNGIVFLIKGKRAKMVLMSPVKKTPSIVYWLEDSLYLNITNQCSNNCFFCFRNYWDGVGGFNLRLREEPSPEMIMKEIQMFINRRHWKEVVFCGYGEPLERLDCVLEVTRWIKTHYGTSVRIDTNGLGFLLNKGRAVVKELKRSGVDRVSVSLNAPDKATYNTVCKPRFENSFESVLEFIRKSKLLFNIEITLVTIPDADIAKFKELAKKMGVKMRTRQYLPCFL